MTYRPIDFPNDPTPPNRAGAGFFHRALTVLTRPFALFGKLLLSTAVLLGACDSEPRPQDPIERPYRVKEVQFSGGLGVTLAGELTMPPTRGPFPAVVLISGTGPQNRDEALAGHKPFLVLSDHLTRAGYAVLRYDDRGVGGSTGDHDTAALTDFTDDAVGAYRFLTAHPEIETSRIGFIGHSEGGYIATEASLRVKPAFSVFLAGPARKLLPDVLVTQTADLMQAEGVPQDTIDIAVRQIEQGSEIMAQPLPLAQKRENLSAYLAAEGFGMRERRVMLQQFATPWASSYARYDPAPSLRALPMPVLSLFGDKDIQVSSKTDAPVMRAALRHPKSEVEVVPGANHLFQPATTGHPAEYEAIPTTISPEVMERITNWLNAL